MESREPRESRLDIVIDLLHRCDDAALATHSLAMPGFPFATALPFAPDEQHRPVFLISALAEHTQNLAADARASLLLRRRLSEGDMARTTLVGEVAQFEPESLLLERYLRYQPDAERFLQIGDFRFFRLEPTRIRTIGGFAQAGWLDGDRLGVSPRLTLAEERAALDALAAPRAASVLGVDRYGIDLRIDRSRHRIRFKAAPVAAQTVLAAAQHALAAHQDRLSDVLDGSQG